MNKKFDDLMYEAGLTADGCWFALDNYDQMAILKLAELIVRECVSICKDKERPNLYGVREVEEAIKQHFGVEE